MTSQQCALPEGCITYHWALLQPCCNVLATWYCCHNALAILFCHFVVCSVMIKAPIAQWKTVHFVSVYACYCSRIFSRSHVQTASSVCAFDTLTNVVCWWSAPYSQIDSRLMNIYRCVWCVGFTCKDILSHDRVCISALIFTLQILSGLTATGRRSVVTERESKVTAPSLVPSLRISHTFITQQ